MKFACLQGINPKLPGIYRIVNTLDGKYYIGGTQAKAGLKGRFSRHLYELKNNKHGNSYLQNAFNQYGVENFQFIGFINAEKEKILNLEQYFLDIFKPYQRDIGYNLCRSAINLKYIRRERIIDNNQTKIKSFPPRYLLNPNNEIIEITNLADFCRKNNLKESSFESLLHGRVKFCLGWRCYEGVIPETKLFIKKNKISYDIVNKNGLRFIGDDYRKICKEFNLNKNAIYKLATKRINYYEGWQRYDSYLNGEKPKFGRKQMNYDVVSPEGVRYQGKNARKFCKEKEISLNTINNLKAGKCKTCNGWKLYKGEFCG